MEPVLFIMAILGCGDSETQCEPVRTVPAIYATADACESAGPGMLMENSDVEYPVVMMRCRPADAKLAMRLTGQQLASR